VTTTLDPASPESPEEREARIAAERSDPAAAARLLLRAERQGALATISLHKAGWPFGSIALASTMTSPAPPTAREPRWTRCQSFARPSVLEYWHIGETASRLRRVTPRSGSGSKRLGILL